jgi:hypothetical protein
LFLSPETFCVDFLGPMSGQLPDEVGRFASPQTISQRKNLFALLAPTNTPHAPKDVGGASDGPLEKEQRFSI